MGAPLTYRWDGLVMVPLARFEGVAAREFITGQPYTLAEVEDRSDVSHKHEFAWLREAWLNLPEAIADEYPSPEHLRKRALIESGFCTITDYACGSHAEARRWAQNLRSEVDEYALVLVKRTVVRVFKAKSQSRRAMDKAEFQASKTAILEWVAGLLQVSSEQLQKAEAA
jgi:hypothetical protein